MRFRYAYLHGFGSSADSRKGVFMRRALGSDGVDLTLLELNVPCFEKLTYSRILAFLDRFGDGGDPLRLIGSSMGAYLAARWGELNPSRVDRLLLLCPGFDLPSRLPFFMNGEQIRRWEREGKIDVETSALGPRPLHWQFVVDARSHPAFPEVPCPTRIVHGRRDDVVPIEGSRRYAAGRPHVDLVEVDDDHALEDSLERVAVEAREFFGLD